jgi:hypothetical protein
MTAMVGGDDDEAIGSVAGDDTKKSERKRKRERQRRSDLTNAMDELAALVSQIDPEEQSDTAAQKKRRRKSGEEAASGNNELDSTNMTRLDLVGRTTMVLRRLQRENAELKRRLEEQQSRFSGDDKVSVLGVSTLAIQSRSAVVRRFRGSSLLALSNGHLICPCLWRRYRKCW